MSDEFDDLLSGVIDTASRAANGPGAAAARERGRKRRNHQRLAASTLSLALLAVVGGVAAVAVHSSNRVPAAHTTGIVSTNATATVSTSPSPTDSRSSSPSPSMSGSPSGTGSAGAGGSTQSSTSGSPASSTPSDWSTLPGSWLSPSEVPLDSVFGWTGGSASTAQTGASLLSQEPIIYPCAASASPNYVTYARTAVDFGINSFSKPGGSSSTFDGSANANQSYATFASDTAAQTAFAAIKQDVAKCSTTTNMVSANTHLPMTAIATTTVSNSDAFAYTYILRDNKGNPAQVNGNYGAASDYHAYVVLKANLIDIVWIAAGPSADASGNDAAALNTMGSALGQ